MLFGVARRSLSFSFSVDAKSVIGVAMVIYATSVYPLVGLATGYEFPRYPIFGVAPCSDVIFTCGLLSMIDDEVPLVLCAVPFIWSMMAIMPVLLLNIYADIGLVPAGITATAFILRQAYKMRNRE